MCKKGNFPPMIFVEEKRCKNIGTEESVKRGEYMKT